MVRGDTFILLHLRIQQNQEDVMVCNVYGPHERRGRELVFNEIGELLEGFAGRVVVGGDFNTILNDGERRGAGENMRGDDSFKLFVNDNYLIDLPQQNGDYTWGSTQNSGLWSRLDRWLINEDALLGFDGVSQVAKDWGVSDHRAICLNWGTKDFGPKPFTFYNFWLMEAGFKEMVAEWWGTNMISGWSGYVLLQKLKGLRGRIRLWCKERGPWGSSKIVLLEKKVNDLMAQMEREGVTVELRRERMMALNDLWKEYRKEESLWLHKSRMKWLMVRDRNTRFFHRVSKMRAARKNLMNLQVNGEICQEPRQIKQAIFDHFHNFFKSGNSGSMRFTGEGVKRVSIEDRDMLEGVFTYDEIWAAVLACDGNRAPGPDDFNFTFFREFWSMIREDIMRMFMECFEYGKLVKGLNAGFIALIPKKQVPELVTDYRPTSLIGSIYKFVAKVLAARLQKVMPYLLSSNQFSFTKGRQIADCIFIANEVVDAM